MENNQYVNFINYFNQVLHFDIFDTFTDKDNNSISYPIYYDMCNFPPVFTTVDTYYDTFSKPARMVFNQKLKDFVVDELAEKNIKPVYQYLNTMGAYHTLVAFVKDKK